ncbi:RNA polymerase sigma factor [Reyranella sp.]|uniref:RNA polymerase sigma factor n=1 Tax=Reyranella sp. TaxID=1929291 RepID=UPI003BAD401F
MAEVCRYVLLQSFAEHRQALMRFLTRRLGNPALAADLAHQTWLRVARRAGGPPGGDPRSHLFRIASDLAIDHQREGDRPMEGEAPDGAAVGALGPSVPANVVYHRSEFARLARVIEAFPPRRREVFLLCRFEGMSPTDVARRLGVSRNAVVSHMVNALTAIEREMDVSP